MDVHFIRVNSGHKWICMAKVVFNCFGLALVTKSKIMEMHYPFIQNVYKYLIINCPSHGSATNPFYGILRQVVHATLFFFFFFLFMLYTVRK